jgi:hypothetical protein
MHGQSREMGLLGLQIQLAVAVFQNRNAEHFCQVRHEVFAGNELLTGDSERQFLVYDCLPGSMHNKAIGLDSKTLFIELTPFDLEAVAESTLPNKVRVTSKAIFYGKRKVASCIQSSEAVAKDKGARALWMVPWQKLDAEQLTTAITCLDILDIDNAYVLELDPAEQENAPAASSSGGMRLELRLGLQMELIQAQVPVLALQQGLRPELSQNLELLQTLRFERLLEQNGEDAVLEYLARDSSPAGQKRLAGMIIFKLARDVKMAAAASGQVLEWPQARKIVRKLMRKAG